MDERPKSLAGQIAGVWSLLSREDRALDGSVREEPTLGSDALGMLTYCDGRFAAQFMKRDRRSATTAGEPKSGLNNTGALNGYDAYFGTYVVDETTGHVLHRLDAALTEANIGLEVTRHLAVDGDRLIIRLDTTAPDGLPVVRSLTWERVGRLAGC